MADAAVMIHPGGEDSKARDGLSDTTRRIASDVAKFPSRFRHAPTRTGRVVQLTGSVIENSHGLHWNTFKSSPIVRLIARNNIIERPQTGQMTSMGADSIIRTPA
jgi:hypothetical protein